MALTLKELEIWTENKDTGWTSGILEFGNKFTYVSGLGENTCGKTPLLKSILFALGVNETFRNDIIEKCSGVRLKVLMGGYNLTFSRSLKESDHVNVCDNIKNETKSYKVEKEISEFIFQHLGYPQILLSGSNGKSAPLYFSSIAPLFWKEQIDSWHTIYSDKFSYIKDQRKEATRFIMGLSPKHPFGIKSEIKKSKKSVTDLTEAISDRSSLIEELKKIFDTETNVDIRSLELEKISIKKRLADIEDDFSTITDATKDFDSAITSLNSNIENKRLGLRDKSSRIHSLKHVINEVEAEIETLTLNDEAADRFRDFNQICNNKQCGMFLLSKESYGKGLVYLKDQVKDLGNNIELLERESTLLKSQVESLEKEVEQLETEKKDSLVKNGAEKLADAIKTNTKRLVEIETKLQTNEKLKSQKDKLTALISKRDKTHQKIEDLETSVSKSIDVKVQSARSKLSSLINDWIKTLEATGLSANATIEPEFKYKFGSEKYTDLDGSLRTRAVLAFHAALFQYGLENDVNHPRILILDTPKQQELKTDDLQEFFKKLKVLCDQYSEAQVVFSSSEFQFTPTDQDRVWTPNFPGEKHPMYLGVSGTELNKS